MSRPSIALGVLLLGALLLLIFFDARVDLPSPAGANPASNSVDVGATSEQLAIVTKGLGDESSRSAGNEPQLAPSVTTTWRADAKMLELVRGAWPALFAENKAARIAEFEARKCGSIFLEEVLTRSGILLEEYPPQVEDFVLLSEAEKNAVAQILQSSATARKSFGENPLIELPEAESQELRDRILAAGLEFPTDYLISALAHPDLPLSDEVRVQAEQLRIRMLRQLAPWVAERGHHQTTGAHMIARFPSLATDYHPGSDLLIIDPEYDSIVFFINDLHLRYLEEMRNLLQQQR